MELVFEVSTLNILLIHIQVHYSLHNILVYIYNFEIMLDSVGLGWTRLDPVELGPPLYYIKRGLLFKFLMEGLELERGLLLVYIR